MMSEKPKFGFVVEYVKDIEASKQFYVDVLGLKVEREHPTYVQFETFAIASDEPVGGEAGEEVFWIVDVAEGAYGSLQH
jgi:catechol 2,3-dioxygenase-like lactoylglutathione lyase family enzyme